MTIKPNDFDISNLDSEMAADRHCSNLLKQFHQQLLKEEIDTLEAGQLAHGADYFLRDFIIADRRQNIFKIDPVHIKQFAGHWYIIKNLEPNIKELATILQGVAVFYSYLLQLNCIEQTRHDQIISATAELNFYQQRIDQFWDICDDGYHAWRGACPLPSID
ncbi:MAG: hypothetical protein B6I36_09185 [Desulfobacteraceae bacterium 4572_35.1]|nr:MAG: hypothetical protein B6I36_09185 [Desulfobacteraceae bacterium 4572_35.1]